MNKIIVDKEELVVNEVTATLDIKNNYLRLICHGKNKIIVLNKENLNLDIILENNSKLDILFKETEKWGSNKILIEQKNDTEINYLDAFKCYKETNLVIENLIKGNNNKSNIVIRTIAYEEKVNIDILANALKKSLNNNLIEDIKGINNGGKITIKPNMEICTNDIIANHFVTIGNIDKNILFYLESKGIKEDTSKDMIIAGFLKSIFREYEDIGGEVNE